MDIQKQLQTALDQMTWAPVFALILGAVIVTTLIFLKIWLRHKFPPAATRIEIVHVNRDSKEVNAFQNEAARSKGIKADDSRYMPKSS